MQDGFTESYTIRRRDEERLNHGSWQPVGTLAAQTFLFLTLPPGWERWSPWLMAAWIAKVLDPDRDTDRLLLALATSRGRVNRRIVGQLLRYPESVRAKILGQLREVRRIAEAVVSDPAKSATGVVASPTARSLVRWEGCTRDEDHFRSTPAGTALLSAIYGRAHGTLQFCRKCWGFMAYTRKGPERKRCDYCRSLGATEAERATGLSMRQRDRWKWALYRMRKRGFAKVGLTTKEKRKQWVAAALAALREAKTPAELDAWDKHFAPKGRPGRKRLHERGGERDGRYRSHAQA